MLIKKDATFESLYLDYFNNFLTVGCFAEYYGMSLEQANLAIDLGRIDNHKRGVK